MVPMTTTPCELSEAECIALLGTTNFGQLALTRGALPTVVPVHFVAHAGEVVVHFVDPDDRVPWLDGDIAALHACVFVDDGSAGWRVCVTGRTRVADARDARDLPRAPWILDGGRLVRLSLDHVCGERLGRRALVAAG